MQNHSAMFLSFIIALVFFNSKIFASPDSVQINDQFNSKTLSQLESKNRGGLIDFNADLFKKLTSLEYTKRDFHLFIIFNALDKETNCQYCGPAQEMFKTNKNLFNKKASKGSLPAYFAAIELKGNMEAFQAMGLDHVPVIYHFGPESRAPKQFDNQNPNDVGAMLRFFAEQSGTQLNVDEAFKPEKNYSVSIVTLTVIAVLAGLMYVEFLTPAMVFKNFYIWSVSIMSFIIVMLSGYMWARIRNAPYVGSGPEGILYIMPNPQSQFGVESRIVSGICAGTVLVFSLITTIVYKFEDNNKRRIAAMIMSLLYMAGHAALMKAFSQKFQGYPISYIF